jgi:hypothetical protein
MKLQFAFLADAAALTTEGAFAVVGGGFDVLKSQKFPAVKAAMSLVGRFLFEPDEMGKPCHVHVEIVGPDDKVIPPDLWLDFKPVPHPRHEIRANWMTFSAYFEAVTFPTPGDYQFRLSMGQQVFGQVALEVVALGDRT